MHVGHDSDDARADVEAVPRHSGEYALADCVALGPQCFRHQLAYDRDGLGACMIGGRECPAAQHARADALEIVVCRCADARGSIHSRNAVPSRPRAANCWNPERNGSPMVSPACSIPGSCAAFASASVNTFVRRERSAIWPAESNAEMDGQRGDTISARPACMPRSISRMCDSDRTKSPRL